MATQKQSILLTGASGGIGRELSIHLMLRGHFVHAVAGRRPAIGDTVQNLDLSDAAAAKAHLGHLKGHIETIIHLAHDQNQGKGDYKSANVQAQNPSMLRNLKDIFGHTARYVLASSVTVYGIRPFNTLLSANTQTAPTDPYGQAKCDMEAMLQDMPNTAVVRLPRVVARHCNNIVNRFIATAAKGQNLRADDLPNSLSPTSSYTSIDNLNNQITRMVETPLSGLFTIHQSAITLRDLSAFIAHNTGVKVHHQINAKPFPAWSVMQDNMGSPNFEDPQAFLNSYIKPLLPRF